MDNVKLTLALEELAKRVKQGFTEDAVEHSLTETKFYEALGYERTGRDIRRKPKGKSGIPDALLLNSDDSIQVVVEVKKPSELLTDHVDQLRRYMLDLRAPYGFLTNGQGFRLYKRTGQAINELSSGATNEFRADDFTAFAKRTVDPLNKEHVTQRVRESQEEGLPLAHADDLASQQFLYSLGLQEGSPFANLVRTTITLLTDLQGKSTFVSGSYDFWKKVYARELDADRIPKLWKDSGALTGTSESDLYRFSFALETSYALTARLMLAKVIQDHGKGEQIAGKRSLADQLLIELERHLHPRTEQLQPDAYPEAVRELFDQYARTLFTSVYATDIFDWWRDYKTAEPQHYEAFADALAKLLLSLLRFDFSQLEGDLLGELYQQYFDPETRKALGEFYTPPAVVNFILDEVGYQGARNERLLDPATGSGTFIITALRRYLAANSQRDPVEVLRGLTEDYALVAFDINPFAVLMAQVNFAALLVPTYAEAAKLDPDFVLRRLPIIRTDSLRQEGIENETLVKGSQQGTSLFGLDFESNEITAQIELPIRAGGKLGHPVRLTFPQVEEAKRQGVVDNEREWLRALQAVFYAVELRSQAFDRQLTLPENAQSIRDFLARVQLPEARLAKQTEYLSPYADKVWETLKELKEEHGDGRFLKTLEDLMLGLVLKHYLKYDYVVGNPPYVRIQQLPEELRRYWEDYYVWTKGNFDIYIPFIERALLGRQGSQEHGWLRNGGRLAYIVPNRFMNTEYADVLRENLPRVADLRSLLNMGAATFQPDQETKASKLFKEAMVYPAILSVQKRDPEVSDKAAAFPAVRLMPRTIRKHPEDALKEVRAVYDDLRAGKQSNLDELGDAVMIEAPQFGDYAKGRRDFTHAGWYVMPETERRVFEKLDEVGREVDPEVRALMTAAGVGGTAEPYRRLKTYTATVSGGFAGIQTSLDSVMVLREVNQSADGQLLTLVPKGGGDQVTIERDALRPFLFGKDVERWHVGWQGWWVVFPYFETDTGFKLMPTEQYRDHKVESKGRGRSKEQAEYRRVFAGYPEDLPNLEKVYPHLWAYLKTNEKALRGRESGKYKIGKSDEWRWYEIAYARSLEYSAKSKLLLQLLADTTNVVTSSSELYFQGGGKGGGVYGVSLNKSEDLHLFACMLAGKAADFFIKLTGTVYSSGYYSYSDAHIRNLPIPSASPDTRKRLNELSQALTEKTGELRQTEEKLSRFPESVNKERREASKLPDLEQLAEVAQLHNLGQNLDGSKLVDMGEALMGHLPGQTTLKLGNGNITLSKEHAELVKATFEERSKMTLVELSELRVPESKREVQGYLTSLAQWRERIAELSAEIETLESELNEVVYELYGLTEEERQVVENFLSRY